MSRIEPDTVTCEHGLLDVFNPYYAVLNYFCAGMLKTYFKPLKTHPWLQVVRCDGEVVLEYMNDIRRVLQLTLHVKCKDGADLAGVCRLRHSCMF